MLTKKQVLKYLTHRSRFRKEVTAKNRQATKLATEAAKLTSILDSLSGIKLHGKFPIRTMAYEGGVEVLSGCSDSLRSAYVKPGTTEGRFVVTAYTNGDDSETDGVPIPGEFSKNKALKIAKDFVSLGRHPVD